MIANFPRDDAETHGQAVETWRDSAGIDSNLILPMAANVDEAEQVAEMYEAIGEQCGGIDILVNNAGINRDHTVAKMTDAEWRTVIAVNLDGREVKKLSRTLSADQGVTYVPSDLRISAA